MYFLISNYLATLSVTNYVASNDLMIVNTEFRTLLNEAVTA
jgi:hypothetical protein